MGWKFDQYQSPTNTYKPIREDLYMKLKPLIILLLISIFLVSGCTVSSPLYPKEQAKNTAKAEFDECNQRCGDGILNSICKEGCTYQYNQKLSEIERGNY